MSDTSINQQSSSSCEVTNERDSTSSKSIDDITAKTKDINLRESSKDKYLVILDASGILYNKYQEKPKNCVDFLQRNNYVIVFRPGILEFITNLMTDYTVAIFSSTTYYNLKPCLEAMLTPTLNKQILFVADRRNVKLDPDYKVDPEIEIHDTVKNLTDIWSHPYYNSKRIWNNHNTILVEHDERKTRFNPSENILIIPEWDPSSSSLCNNITSDDQGSINRSSSNKSTTLNEESITLNEESITLEEESITLDENILLSNIRRKIDEKFLILNRNDN